MFGGGSERAPGIQRRRNGLIVRPNVDPHCYGTNVAVARYFATTPIVRADRAGGSYRRHADRPRELIRLRSSFLRAQCLLSQRFLVESQSLVGRGQIGKDPAQTFAFRFPAVAQAARGLAPEFPGIFGHASYPRCPAARSQKRATRNQRRESDRDGEQRHEPGSHVSDRRLMECNRALESRSSSAAPRLKRSSHHPPCQTCSRHADRNERPEGVELKRVHAVAFLSVSGSSCASPRYSCVSRGSG
jgi:hypothetical protein